MHLEEVEKSLSIKKVFWEISQNSQESTCTRVSFLIKLQASGLQRRPQVCNFLKKQTLAQVFLRIVIS